MVRPFAFASAAVAIVAALLIGLVMSNPEGLAESRLRAGKSLRVGYAIEAPFALMTPEGEVSGEAPEVLRAVLGKAGIGQVEWLYSDFASLLVELDSGRIDVIAAGMYATPERRGQVLFTRPTAVVVPGLLIRAASRDRLHGLEDLRKLQDARLAVISGAVEGELALKAGLVPTQIIEFPDARSAAFAVANNRADAFALASLSLRYLLADRDMEGLLVVPAFAQGTAVSQGLPAFVFRKGDAALRDKVDAILANYLGSPEHLALVARFGLSAEDVKPALALAGDVARHVAGDAPAGASP